ncbi:LytR C-terminal domain-containing protein [Aeromicrobium sp. IC_218]|uniref:LytR C-terminal domain-containing protein n=1 Tax=Aeromicrobium sp. IC_218 TaxID=2545468 RepID=UPI0010393653|nr:LytR C-terminal domain-containing protein [Aeromicrobium sp. IC_218]TCI99033.1 LytR family transcriptional regulator [Aeromicrobium sp. IC_218]
MDHRRTPTRRAVILPSWLIVGTALLLAAAAAYLVVTLLDDDESGSPRPAASASPTAAPTSSPAPSEVPTPSPTPSPSPSPSPTPSPSPSPSETPSAEPEPARDVPVVVFNNTGRSGLAAEYAGRARGAGWTVEGVGNWRGSIPSSTVYHPAGQRAAAERLARDLGLDRVRERVAPMRADRLTVVLSGTR